MGILGTSIRNTEDFYQVRNNSKIGDLWEITYVRNGIEKNNLNIWIVLIHIYFYNVQTTILTKQKK